MARPKIGVNLDIPYLKVAIGRPLIECLSNLVVARPPDPIEYIAVWLYQYRDKMLYLEEKRKFCESVICMTAQLEEENKYYRLRAFELRTNIKLLKIKKSEKNTQKRTLFQVRRARFRQVRRGKPARDIKIWKKKKRGARGLGSFTDSSKIKKFTKSRVLKRPAKSAYHKKYYRHFSHGSSSVLSTPTSSNSTSFDRETHPRVEGVRTRLRKHKARVSDTTISFPTSDSQDTAVSFTFGSSKTRRSRKDGWGKEEEVALETAELTSKESSSTSKGSRRTFPRPFPRKVLADREPVAPWTTVSLETVDQDTSVDKIVINISAESTVPGKKEKRDTGDGKERAKQRVTSAELSPRREREISPDETGRKISKERSDTSHRRPPSPGPGRKSLTSHKPRRSESDRFVPADWYVEKRQLVCVHPLLGCMAAPQPITDTPVEWAGKNFATLSFYDPELYTVGDYLNIVDEDKPDDDKWNVFDVNDDEEEYTSDEFYQDVSIQDTTSNG